jgi:hypothetical protein
MSKERDVKRVLDKCFSALKPVPPEIEDFDTHSSLLHLQHLRALQME